MLVRGLLSSHKGSRAAWGCFVLGQGCPVAGTANALGSTLMAIGEYTCCAKPIHLVPGGVLGLVGSSEMSA